ncbi:MAG: hypothetical protein ABIO70_23410 [Pseudomonadota bacterium]
MQPLFGLAASPQGQRPRHAAREREAAQDEREAFLEEKARLKEQGIDLDAPTEGLACPRCKAGYAFGDVCPDCGVELVGMSAVDKVDPVQVVTGPDRGWLWFGLLPGLVAALAGIAIWIWIAGQG